MFKLRLLEATSQLAKRIGVTPQDLGTLHTGVLETEPQITLAEFLLLSEHARTVHPDAEKALKGNEQSDRVLFFVRELPDRPTSLPALPPGAAPAAPPTPFARRMSHNGIDGASWPHNYANKEYKLRTMRRVRDSIIDKLGARQSDVSRILGGCRDHISTASRPVLDAGAIYVSIFTERYREDGSGEVLVYDFAKHQVNSSLCGLLRDASILTVPKVPSWRLDIRRLNAQMRDWIRLRAGTSASDLYDMCKDCSSDQAGHPSMIGFLDALASALERLMDDLAFLGFEVVSQAHLNPYVVNVPAASSGGDMAQMIVLNTHHNDEKDADSDQTHVNGIKPKNKSTVPPNLSRMPSVFTYTPRSLFDILHSLVSSPSIRDAISLEAAVELDQILGDKPADKKRKFASNIYHSSRSDEGPWGHQRGRRPHALVSSFSIDSATDDSNSTNGNINTTQLVTRVRETWMALKDRTRSIAPRLHRSRSMSRVSIRRVFDSPAASSATLIEAQTPSPPLPTYSIATSARSAIELSPPPDTIASKSHLDGSPRLVKRPSLGRARAVTTSGAMELSGIARASNVSAVDVPMSFSREATKRSVPGRSKYALTLNVSVPPKAKVTAAGTSAVDSLAVTVSPPLPEPAKRPTTAPRTQLQLIHVGRSRSAIASSAMGPPPAPPPRRSLPPIPPAPRLLPPLPPIPQKATATQLQSSLQLRANNNNRRSWMQMRNASRSVSDLPDRRR